jgi:Cft2 family RNA processing exonuclease
MASAARLRIREISTPKPTNAPISREQEILKEFESFFSRHIGAMSPSQLRKFEQRSAEILEESRSRSNEAVSTHEKEQSSLRVRPR